MVKISSFFSFLLFLLIADCLFLGCQQKNKTEVSALKKEIDLDSLSVDFNQLPQDFSTNMYDTIRKLFYSMFPKNDFNGMFLIAKHGKIIFEHYQGTADAQKQLDFNSETPVHVASISKNVTSIAVLRLVDQKKIELDKDIRTYLPLIPYNGITVRMLLNHRSGIPYYGYFPTDILPYTDTLTNKKLLEILNKHRFPLYFPSNTEYSYCNTNYALLALIIEKVTKQTFQDAMKRLVFEPLKMKHSFIYNPNQQIQNSAQSYDSKYRLEPVTNLDHVVGDKNLYTTARDLLKFDRATYSDRFLSKKMKAELFKGYSYERPGKSNYGLGIRIREQVGKSPFFFHTGWWHGNTGCYATMRADTVCMIILSNHFTRSVYRINRISSLFGNYPYEPLTDPKENFIQPRVGIKAMNKKRS